MHALLVHTPVGNRIEYRLGMIFLVFFFLERAWYDLARSTEQHKYGLFCVCVRARVCVCVLL